jgi:pimeloyl-ACP methyl ester carboxylesterase
MRAIAEAHEEHGMVVRRLGKGSTARVPELVWIHGLGERASCFDAIATRLDGLSHVFVDLPGYGDSQPPVLPGTTNSLDHLAAHLSEWLTSWPARPAPILLGHSMGGVLATLIAERIPVRGVIDIDGNLSRGDCTFSAEAAGYTCAGFVESGLAAMRATVAVGGAADPALRGYAEALGVANAAVFHRHAVDLVELSVTENLAPRLAALATPVLFIAGVPGGICERSLALLDQHRLPWVGVEPSGHWPFIDQAELFAAAVRAFVRDLA